MDGENQNNLELPSKVETEKTEKPKKKSHYVKKGGNGGVRNGAGRPKKEVKVITIKKAFKDYLDEKEVLELVALAKKTAKTDPIILKFVLEQIFGKAPQSLKVGGDDNNKTPIGVIMIPEKK